MATVTATNTMDIAAPAADVCRALADYVRVRPEIQPENYSAYRVRSGGQGEGTVVAWNLQATKKRNRDVEATVTEAGSPETHWELVEKDANSSMVTSYVVRPTTEGSLIEMTTSWKGAGGIGGFFEKTFAPAGLRRIQHELLTNLRDLVQREAGTAS